MSSAELAFFSDLDFLCFSCPVLIEGYGWGGVLVTLFFLYCKRIYKRDTLCEEGFIGSLCCQWVHHGREVCCLLMFLLQQRYLANSLRLVSSMEEGPRGSWSNNIWSLEERAKDLFIPGPQSRRTLLICKVCLPTFVNLT